jgi:hypothetical protein
MRTDIEHSFSMGRTQIGLITTVSIEKPANNRSMGFAKCKTAEAQLGRITLVYGS